MKTKAFLRREIRASENRTDAELTLRGNLRQQLATLIAKEKGIVAGREYYVLPIPGRKYRAKIESVGLRDSTGDDLVVAVRFYNSRGAFQRKWLLTPEVEFLPIKEARNGRK